MTGAEAIERDDNQREKAANKEVKAEEAAEDIEEEAVEDPFWPPPSTARAAIQTSRAGRKRAPTIKALLERRLNGVQGRARAEAGQKVKIATPRSLYPSSI